MGRGGSDSKGEGRDLMTRETKKRYLQYDNTHTSNIIQAG